LGITRRETKMKLTGLLRFSVGTPVLRARHRAGLGRPPQ
jgi:hypothetical protein